MSCKRTIKGKIKSSLYEKHIFRCCDSDLHREWLQHSQHVRQIIKRISRKNPRELNKTVWLKFNEGRSLFRTHNGCLLNIQYAGPGSLCPRPHCLQREQGLFTFSPAALRKQAALTFMLHSGREVWWWAALPAHSFSSSPQHLNASSFFYFFLPAYLSSSVLSCSFFIFLFSLRFCLRGRVHLQKRHTHTKKCLRGLNVKESCGLSPQKLHFFLFFPPINKNVWTI